MVKTPYKEIIEGLYKVPIKGLLSDKLGVLTTAHMGSAIVEALMGETPRTVRISIVGL